MTRFVFLATTCLQSEWVSDVLHCDCQGYPGPSALRKNCRSLSTKVKSEIGVERRRHAILVKRSKVGSGALLKRPVHSSAEMRSGADSCGRSLPAKVSSPGCACDSTSGSRIEWGVPIWVRPLPDWAAAYRA